MSSGPFNCIFCTESFKSREVLQVHFRKHGDPNLHAKLKTSKKLASGGGGAAGAEEVSCDVCSERLPSVARAITHKHKFHGDHRVKNFCPWCGKLFPIKHLLDKHVVVHSSQEKPAQCEQFGCDECQFEFYSCAAVSYHNRSYHRADAPAPGALAASKKYRLLNKELVQVFFCHLCGDEYINILNLQKHISEQHAGPEWLEPPAELLRCPRCDAAFHSRGAYVAHLAHHTPDDVYTHPHETLNDITEFTIETLAPIIEKMEPPEQIDIDEMLAVDLELSSSRGSREAGSPPPEPEGSEDKKSNGPAPRRAITLNQFLSMNKDVFGDVFSCQGVEEVPSQVVANQLRPKRPPPKRLQQVIKPGTKIMSADNLQRLKQQGVVVQVKSPHRKPVQVGHKVTVANGVAIAKSIKIATGAHQQPKLAGMMQKQPNIMKQQPKAATGNIQHAKVAMGVAQQPKVAAGVMQQSLKVATSMGQQPLKVAPGAGQQQLKVATSVGQPLKVAQTVGQKQKIVNSAGQQPKVATGLSMQPKPAQGRPAGKLVKAPAPGPPSPTVGKPLKISPTMSRPPARPMQAKKPAETDASAPGPFSCFKKPKESLIPISDVPGIAELLRPEPTGTAPTQSAQVTTSFNTGKTSPNLATPKPTLTVTHQPERPSQEVNKNKHKGLPLEALEKLKKQGLLVKKPKLDSEGSREASQSSDAPCLTVKSGG